ncbi:rod-binding protein [Falsirhodobacter sp. alg1]|uniref:rod-binding protein n=1 Tax=Falsirhodobacter sp. alg1 TaxID=1472418 RepID=UPI000787903C|nr:rod-binding protein [Falsirhodobacter sp. alg1]
MIPPVSSAISPPPNPLREKAQELEAAFLAEMLGHAGLDGLSGDFGGGAGEEQFSSFLRAEQAKAMVQKGGIGLSESIYRAMGGTDDHA